MPRLKRPWDYHESESNIGPETVPWDIREFVFRPAGHFIPVAQKFSLDPKTRRITAHGYHDTRIQGGRDLRGSPILTKAQCEAVYALADTEQIALGLAFIRLHGDRMTPDYRRGIEDALPQPKEAAEETPAPRRRVGGGV